MQVDRFLGSTLAILLLFIGKGLVAGVEPLRRYRISEALAGGMLYVATLRALARSWLFEAASPCEIQSSS